MRGIVRDAYSEVRLGVGIGRDHFGAFLEVVNDDDVLIRTHAGQNKKSNQSSMNCFNFLPALNRYGLLTFRLLPGCLFIKVLY